MSVTFRRSALVQRKNSREILQVRCFSLIRNGSVENQLQHINKSYFNGVSFSRFSLAECLWNGMAVQYTYTHTYIDIREINPLAPFSPLYVVLDLLPRFSSFFIILSTVLSSLYFPLNLLIDAAHEFHEAPSRSRGRTDYNLSMLPRNYKRPTSSRRIQYV